MSKVQNDSHIFSTIFSSIVKTSVSEAALSKQKKSKHLSSLKAPPAQDPAAIVAAKDKEPSKTKNEWVKVPTKSGSKYQKSASSVSLLNTEKKDYQQKRKKTLTNNKFFVPDNIEKRLHNSAHTGTASSKKEPQAEITEEQRRKAAKCFKRNQRRARIRAQKRAEKETADFSLSDVTLISSCEIGDTSATSIVTQEVYPVMDKSLEKEEEFSILCLPYDSLTDGVMSYLRPEEMAFFGQCNKYSKQIAEEGHLWQSMFKKRFPLSQLTPVAIKEWKLAYQLTLSRIVDSLRCFHTKKTFFEDVLGVGIDYTVNPLTHAVDYISLSQDLLSQTAFTHHKIREDVFGNEFKLFLPLYFSEEHFQRALPQIRRTIVRLCPDRKTSRFDPMMVLNVFPKIVNTFVVLLSDEGVSASRKSRNGLIRIHRLFLALAHEYPGVKNAATKSLKLFIAKEENRVKQSCKNLGCILPLLMIVDKEIFNWLNIRSMYLAESFDRSVLWACKKYPQLEQTNGATGQVEDIKRAEERVKLTFEAMTVSLRLIMFHVYFVHVSCQGTTQDRCNRYDYFFGQPEQDEEKAGYEHGHESLPQSRQSQSTLSFSHFREKINRILSITTWQQFFRFVEVRCPNTKADMARILRQHVKNSRRKGYHKAGMDFSRIHASGSSKILSKGQEYSTSLELRRVVFVDSWSFQGHTKYLDATCLLFSGKKLIHTVDYRNTHAEKGAVVHSGDVMTGNSGTHTIHMNLSELPASITSCMFVISAWADATLADIVTPAVAFTDADAEPDTAPLCTYKLENDDKVDHLTSVIMCKLYRSRKGGWHVLAIGDAHRGAADNYDPIYAAAQKLI